jgi:hypothetical protein
LKDIIRDKTKESLLKVYRDYIDKKKLDNSKALIAEEEFKNYIEIL